MYVLGLVDSPSSIIPFVTQILHSFADQLSPSIVLLRGKQRLISTLQDSRLAGQAVCSTMPPFRPQLNVSKLSVDTAIPGDSPVSVGKPPTTKSNNIRAGQTWASAFDEPTSPHPQIIPGLYLSNIKTAAAYCLDCTPPNFPPVTHVISITSSDERYAAMDMPAFHMQRAKVSLSSARSWSRMIRAILTSSRISTTVCVSSTQR